LSEQPDCASHFAGFSAFTCARLQKLIDPVKKKFGLSLDLYGFGTGFPAQPSRHPALPARQPRAELCDQLSRQGERLQPLREGRLDFLPRAAGEEWGVGGYRGVKDPLLGGGRQAGEQRVKGAAVGLYEGARALGCLVRRLRRGLIPSLSPSPAVQLLPELKGTTLLLIDLMRMLSLDRLPIAEVNPIELVFPPH
jgi:hypothetical protein